MRPTKFSASLGDAPLKVLMNAFRGVYVVRDGDMKVVSPALAEMLGYSATELMARPLHEFHIERERVPAERALLARQRGELPPSLITVHYQARKGAIVQARLHSVTNTYRGEPALVGVYLSLEYVDESQVQLTHARRALEESEESFRLLFFHSPCPMYVIERAGLGFLEVNDAAVKHTGYTRAELHTMTLADIRPAEDVPRLLTEVRDHSREGIDRGLWRHRRKNGDIRDVRVWRQLLRYKGVEAFICVIEDQTEQLREEQLERQRFEREHAARQLAEEQRRRADFLAEAGSILSRTLDFDETLKSLATLAVPEFADWCTIDILESSESFTRRAALHADPEKNALLRTFTERYIERSRQAHPLMRALFKSEAIFMSSVTETYLETVSTDQPYREMLRTLGLSSAIAVPLAARGRPLGAMTFVRGSNQPPFSQDDFALTQQLAQRAALAADNARLYEQAQRAVSVRDEFMSIASHELKTPLTALQGYLQFIQLFTNKKGEAPPGPDLSEMLICAESQSQRMLRLVNDLLDVANIRSGKLSISPAVCDLSVIVAEVIRRLEPVAGIAGSTIGLKGPGGLTGRWDQTRLEQVTTNLLSNAIKYGRGRPIQVQVEDAGDAVRLVISDQGIGIAPEMRDRIFERFERLVSANDYAGLGLGLYIVRQIVEAHGGRIRVESETGEGSRFEVILPRN